MTITHHPSDATLMAYAAGGLSEPFAVLVAAHTELCSHCRDALRRMAAVGGTLMADAPPSALEESAADRLMDALDSPEFVSVHREKLRAPPPANAGDLPEALARVVGGGINAIQWRDVIPGAQDRRYSFPQDEAVHFLRFVRAEPGRELPEHSHVGTELTLVLRGALADGGKIYRRGDVTDLGEDGTHNPKVHGEETCLCVFANEAPPQFTSPEVRALQRRIGI